MGEAPEACIPLFYQGVYRIRKGEIGQKIPGSGPGHRGEWGIPGIWFQLSVSKFVIGAPAVIFIKGVVARKCIGDDVCHHHLAGTGVDRDMAESRRDDDRVAFIRLHEVDC